MSVVKYGQYVNAEDVLRYLKIDYTEDDVNFLNDIIIPAVCDEIDEIANKTWRKTVVKNEYKRMGYPRTFGIYVVSRAVFLDYYPVKEITKLEVYRGGNTYEDWTDMEEGRFNRYWVDYEKGIIWFNWLFFRTGYYEVRVSYIAGDYNEDDDSPNPNGYVKMMALLWSAYRFLDSERFSNRVADGISEANTYGEQMRRLKKEIDYYKDRIAGYRFLADGML